MGKEGGGGGGWMKERGVVARSFSFHTSSC